MTTRWYQLLLRTFPAHVRRQTGDEMLEALEAAEPSGRRVFAESLALVTGSTLAWHRHLSATRSVRGAAFVGALVWFGIVLGAGPGIRLRVLARGDTNALIDTPLVVLAAALFVLSLIALLMSRTASIAFGCGAVITAGASTTIGSWGVLDSVAYEARWSGFALGVAVALAPPNRKRRPKAVVLLPLATATAVILMLWPSPLFQSGRNYAMTIRFEFVDLLTGTMPSWLFAALLLTAAVLPLINRAVGAAVAPVAAHLLLMDPVAGLLAVTYLAAVFGFHYVRRNLTISLHRRPYTQ